MNKNWESLLKTEFQKSYFIDLQKKVSARRSEVSVYPPEDLTFSAFDIEPSSIKVVILGQDPYHGKGQAHGMSFSVLPGTKIPPSLKNMYKEISAEFGIDMSKDIGYLIPWAEQGVFLLNGVMTVEESKPNSHQGWGWEIFTDEVIKSLSNNQSNIVFMLWGAYSRKKANLIDANKHLILESPHPSPFSAHTGFLGNNHFKLANEYLKNNGKEEIYWRI